MRYMIDESELLVEWHSEWSIARSVCRHAQLGRGSVFYWCVVDVVKFDIIISRMKREIGALVNEIRGR